MQHSLATDKQNEIFKDEEDIEFEKQEELILLEKRTNKGINAINDNIQNNTTKKKRNNKKKIKK